MSLFDDDEPDVTPKRKVKPSPSEPERTGTCTTLDHCWPIPSTGKIDKGAPCYCGTHFWGVEFKYGKAKQ